MRKALAVLSLLFLWGLVAPDQTYAQVLPAGATRFSNEWVAANFGRWQLRAASGFTGTGTQTLTFVGNGGVTATGGQQFTPFTTTTRITVGLGATQETVTPTTVSSCGPPQGTTPSNNCAVTASFTYAHGAGTPVISGSGGFDEAANVAHNNGGGLLFVDNTSGITDALIQASTAIFNNVSVETLQGNANPSYYQVRPTTLAALSTPVPRVAAASCPTPIISTTVCDGTAVGTWTNTAYYVCVFYVDQMGQKSPCSTTANYTSAGSLAIFFSSPAASTGAVGWGAAIGTSYAAAYQIPITSSICTLSTVETVTPACAMGASANFPTPTTATALHPGYVVATYNPSDITHTTWAYLPTHTSPICAGLLADWTPGLATSGGTTTQKQVVASFELPNGCLNQISKTLRFTGKIAMTNGTSETPQFLVQLGPTFTTGTPTNICTLTDTTALTAAANSVNIECVMTVNATGTSGTVMPGGFSLTQLQAGTTAGAAAVDSATAAITDNLVGTAGESTTLYLTYIGTGGTSTAVQLMEAHLEMP